MLASSPSPAWSTRAGRINFDDLNSQHKYARWGAYAQSKLANLLFAYELQRRLASHGCSAISLAAHPGYSATNLQTTGAKLDQSRLLLWAMKLGNALLAQPAPMGALPVLYAAVAPDVLGCDYIGLAGLFGLRGYPVKTQSSAALPRSPGRRPPVVDIRRDDRRALRSPFYPIGITRCISINIPTIPINPFLI